MRNISIKLINDTDRTRIKRPETNTWVEIPNSTGGFDVSANTSDFTKASTANGIMCGAIDTEMMKTMPLPAPGRLLGFLPVGTEQICPEQEGKVRGCENGVTDLEAGKCDSMLNLMIYGCTGGLVDLMQPMGEPDVDANGDGKGDAYSTVMKVAAQRVTVSPNGFAEGEPMATPITVK